jgi:hypothetical protein
LMLSAFEREAQRRPDLVADYRAPLERLAREDPLPRPIDALAQKAVATIIGHLPPA